MSKKVRQCSICGKLSRHKYGEYVRQNRTTGYINQEEDEFDPVCSDCREGVPIREKALIRAKKGQK